MRDGNEVSAGVMNKPAHPAVVLFILHQLALVAGFLAFFLAFGIGQDLTSFAGRGLVSVATIYLLRRLWVRIRERESEAQEPV